jgi:ribosomal protein S18 acetylase RimI-like enzyme
MIEPILRPSAEADQDFLAALYASTRADELAATGWPQDFTRVFCDQQFAAQTAHYQTHYATAHFSLIELNDLPVGRMIVQRSPSTLHLVDISLLPTARGQGLGSRLLGDLITEARTAGKNVCLRVEKMNRTRRLYERLGFQEVADEGISWRMEWQATPSLTVNSTACDYDPLPPQHPFDLPDWPRVPSAAAALYQPLT